jgi:hypothetical protein
METTNASLLVAFRKSKNYMMPNKILNELKNLSQLQQATCCLHFSLPKTLDPCTFKVFRNSETLHNLATSLFKITFHHTHHSFASIFSFLSMV